jgi:hypothetical protein
VAAELSPTVDSISYQVWRYIYAQERALIKYVRARVKGEPELFGPKEVLRYYELINDEIFFQPDEYERVRGLYEAFQEHPKLSLGIARELQGDVFDCTGTDPTNQAIRDAIYHGQHDLLQACFYVEHRARLAILKAAVDLAMSNREPKPALAAGREVIFTELDFLPDNFRRGLDALREDQYAACYPLFWQVFTWAFGGFLLDNLKEQECVCLESLTGIPRDQIENAIGAFDCFFPKSTPWFMYPHRSRCRVLQFVPMPIQGLGAFHRKLRYAVEDYNDLGDNDYTERDLRKWHNVGYELLARRGDLKVIKN